MHHRRRIHLVSRAGVEVGVIEVGLGGRLDATNVWQGGVSAITNVALDHMEYLGDTVEAIAREKAAIIKRGDSRGRHRRDRARARCDPPPRRSGRRPPTCAVLKCRHGSAMRRL